MRMYNNNNNNKSHAVAENTIRTTNINMCWGGLSYIYTYTSMILNRIHGSKYYGKLVVDESFERVNFAPNPFT